MTFFLFIVNLEFDMVNDKTEEFRVHIVKLLKESTIPLSGEKISGNLGISRVAVWKHIQFLRESGYDIQSTSKGYVLEELPDNLDPWSFPGLAYKVYHFDSCVSTMEQARDIWRYCEPPYAVVAGKQTGGWGKEGSRWDSPVGGMYFTLVVPHLYPLAQAGNYNSLILNAVMEVLEENWSIRTELKDDCRLFVEGRKICGVLTELYGPFDSHIAAAIGCGLYVLTGEEARIPSLMEILQKPLSRRKIMEEILKKVTLPEISRN